MAKFVLYKDRNDEFRWRFKANNGQIIADSGEGYTNKSDCVNGINFVKQHSPSAPIEDLT
ncbi:MAG: YegP family protein [Candidatus Omnitrophica bacterium]|nr:YegP family protein [Candidatus Omnitrophota bacterium]